MSQFLLSNLRILHTRPLLLSTRQRRRRDLVLFEVTQGLDNDGAALLLRVPGFQPHNILGAADQVLNLPLVFHDLLPLSLETQHSETNQSDLLKDLLHLLLSEPGCD